MWLPNLPTLAGATTCGIYTMKMSIGEADEFRSRAVRPYPRPPIWKRMSPRRLRIRHVVWTAIFAGAGYGMTKASATTLWLIGGGVVAVSALLVYVAAWGLDNAIDY